MIFDYLKSDDGLVLAIVADTSNSAKIGCEYLYVHSSARDKTIVYSPSGEKFILDLTEFKTPTPSDYLGTVEIKCLTSN